MKIRPSFIICILILVLALVLFGLLFPAIPNDTVPAPVGLTQVRVANLLTALQAYRKEYGEFPHGDVVNVLNVLETRNNDGQNPRKLVFMDFRRPKKFLFWETRKGDRDKDGRYLDGWNHPFVIEFSQDRQQATVKSYGKNGKDDDGKYDDIVGVTTPPATNRPIDQPISP